MRLGLSGALAASAFAVMTLASADAAGLPAAPGIAAGTPSLVERVHDCHRSVQLGPAGWHYHTGRSCRRVAAAPPVIRRAVPVCRQECVGVGGLQVCQTKCY